MTSPTIGRRAMEDFQAALDRAGDTGCSFPRLSLRGTALVLVLMLGAQGVWGARPSCLAAEEVQLSAKEGRRAAKGVNPPGTGEMRPAAEADTKATATGEPRRA